MSEQAGPYSAVGQAADVRVEPRAPERATPYLWAVFVALLAGATLTWLRREAHADSYGQKVTLNAVYMLAIPLSVVWALLSDRVAVMGSRRDGYVLIAALLALSGWVALPFVPQEFAYWCLVIWAVALASKLTAVTAGGALAEIGQRRGMTGRLAAAFVGTRTAADLLSWPLFERLSEHGLGWTAGINGAFVVSVALLITLMPRDEPGTSERVTTVRETDRMAVFFGSRTFWVPLLVVALAALGSATTLGLSRAVGATWERNGISAPPGASWLRPIVSAVLVTTYLLLCQRIKPKIWFRVCLTLQALGCLLLFALPDLQDPRAFLFSELGIALGALADIAVLDLVLRAAPRGREAFGVLVLTGADAVFTATGRYFEPRLGSQIAWLGLGACALAVLAVGALPGRLLMPAAQK